jgi:hypothetical protein
MYDWLDILTEKTGDKKFRHGSHLEGQEGPGLKKFILGMKVAQGCTQQ